MEDWLKCQISPLVKYRQNQTSMFFSVYFRGECKPVPDPIKSISSSTCKYVPPLQCCLFSNLTLLNKTMLTGFLDILHNMIYKGSNVLFHLPLSHTVPRSLFIVLTMKVLLYSWKKKFRKEKRRPKHIPCQT